MPMGKPPMYKTVDEIEEKIEKYFEDCKGHPLTDSEGKQVFNKFSSPVFVDVHPPTITGLALALGFASRQALLNYQTKPEFNDTITRAKARVEQYAEERLFDRDGSNGAQFSLRNNFKGWDADKKNDNSGDRKITIVNNIPRPEKQNE
ncbi:DNA-packaging protein [Blautia obeum]|uniref:DNA-packaging protein n=1 Tax=Blautia obeum TaxID=40520 RepID=UPI001FA89FD9|nr:DNA-packaging protein [Blautia obeum]